MVDVEDARRPITCLSDVQLFKVRRLLAGSRRDCRKACRPLDKGYFQAARRTARPTVQVPSPISIVTTVCCRRTRVHGTVPTGSIPTGIVPTGTVPTSANTGHYTP